MCLYVNHYSGVESMKPPKLYFDFGLIDYRLTRHLEMSHGHVKGKLVEYSQSNVKSLQHQQTLMRNPAKFCELTLKLFLFILNRRNSCINNEEEYISFSTVF